MTETACPKIRRAPDRPPHRDVEAVAPAKGGAGAAAALVRATRAEFLAGRQALVLEIVAGLLDEPNLERALDAFASTLRTRFDATRATVALASDDGTLTFGTIAGQARVDTSSAEVRLLLDAMTEGTEQGTTARYPATGDRLGALVAHRTLAGRREDTVLVSVPMYHDGRLVAAFMLERRDPDAFSAPTRDLLERIALAAAPLIGLHRVAGRGPLDRLGDDIGALLERRLGSSRPGGRFAVAIGAATLAALCLVPVERHVVAEAELVPQERRLVTAPVSGYIETVSVVAGERVAEGQLLARLDRRELELEATRRDSEIGSAEAEFRSAMASHDRKATAVARARLSRERTLRELVERRLERSDLRAPIAGVVVSSDPADRAGAPVTRGDTLFEIAPASGYEVHLLVDERDIRDVRAGQQGKLALRARPGEALPLDVQAIHPVAESADGASRFRVRAELLGPVGDASASADVALARVDGTEPGLGAAAPALRPGERGTVRLAAGRTTIAARLARPVGRRLAALWWRFGG